MDLLIRSYWNMLEQSPLAPSLLKPITRLLVSVKSYTRQWIAIGFEAVVVADTWVLPMKPTVELVDTAVESTFPVRV